jgi:predicted lipoprotein with Yx(FWY)xxD motif
MRRFLGVLATATITIWACGPVGAEQNAVEDYQPEAMPPGFQVVISELEGPVFADGHGMTLYTWPLRQLRNGDAGEQKGKPSCANEKYTENAGLMSPYPGGFILPEVERRPSCTGLWPPVLASDDDKDAGKFSIVKRPDGRKQWAYDGFALYTSVLDHRPGDVNGGTKRRPRGEGGAPREPIAPKANVPPGFKVLQTATGRMVITASNASVYIWDKDGADKSACYGTCTDLWSPVIAPESAQSRGEWSVFERSPGVKQWAFRKKPLYTYVLDPAGHPASFEGSDVPGWHNVFTQRVPEPPKGFFTIQDAPAGQVLADAKGHTIYVYNCNDDAIDQFACDHPDMPQAYRFAVCGAGDPAKCMRTFPYVLAPRGAKSGSQIWTAIDLDPRTGHKAVPGQPDALHVWAYRDRPVFTFVGDKAPGDMYGDSWGEFQGARNGFKAFTVRDDYFSNAN